ncbi:hypothetical protein E2C01_038588 [Portunus trituberculatus]|uniref:Uncharacterized protein n=1 Tax=Portunus trituberculatus TaxID=210409 RepID=A0A5B7FH75_PORTR|nr:hypothetical protein [Portunus trituberculatus]
MLAKPVSSALVPRTDLGIRAQVRQDEQEIFQFRKVRLSKKGRSSCFPFSVLLSCYGCCGLGGSSPLPCLLVLFDCLLFFLDASTLDPRPVLSQKLDELPKEELRSTLLATSTIAAVLAQAHSPTFRPSLEKVVGSRLNLRKGSLRTNRVKWTKAFFAKTLLELL